MSNVEPLPEATIQRILRAAETSLLPNADLARAYNISVARLERLMKKHEVKRTRLRNTQRGRRG